MVTSRFRFSHSSLSLSCRTESFDSYVFDREGCGDEGPFSNWDSISREVFPISLPTLSRKMRYLPDLPYLFVFSNRYSVMV